MGTIVTSIINPQIKGSFAGSCPRLTPEDGLETNWCKPGGGGRRVAALGAVPGMGAGGLPLPLAPMQTCPAGCWDGLRLSPIKPGRCFQVDVYEGRNPS